MGKRTSIERFFGRALVFFCLQRPPVCGCWRWRRAWRRAFKVFVRRQQISQDQVPFPIQPAISQWVYAHCQVIPRSVAEPELAGPAATVDLGEEREVGICPPTRKYLWKYIHQHRVASDESVQTLFTNIAGRSLSPSGVEKLLHRVRDAAGLEELPITAHKFRHTFARSWLERGGEVMGLSRVMGHSSVKVTEIYLDDFQSRQARTQHAKFSPLGDLRLPRPGRGHPKQRRPQQEPGSPPSRRDD